MEGSSSQPLPPISKESEQPSQRDYAIITRRGVGYSGDGIPLCTNHYNVSVRQPDVVFYQYAVNITTENGDNVDGKGIGRKIMNQLCKTYSSVYLDGKKLAYDGEKTLFTVGPLPQNDFDFKVTLEGSISKRSDDGSPSSSTSKRSKRSFLPRSYNVQIQFAAKIPLSSVLISEREASTPDNNVQDALRVLDIVLRQQATERGCLLVRQSFFLNNRNPIKLGGGVIGIRGFHSSFRPTHGGLSLNIDVSTTMILEPGPVINFLLANQSVQSPQQIDWTKAARMLRRLRVKALHRNMEFKIIGLSPMPCNQQLFSMKIKDGERAGQTIEITVYDYFKKYYSEPTSSAYFPCLDVGKPNRPNYLPMEFCHLITLQRYTKALSGRQRASLVEKSRQKPREKIKTLNDAMRTYSYDEDPFLAGCGISIEKQMTQVQGRVLNPPVLKFGKNTTLEPNNGRWNFNGKFVVEPRAIKNWAVVNFSFPCNSSRISYDLFNYGRKKGIEIDQPSALVEEDPQWENAAPVERVERMIAKMLEKVEDPYFILCILPERKNSALYGPWKNICLTQKGYNTQCICPTKINDQYLTNVLLKINSKAYQHLGESDVPKFTVIVAQKKHHTKLFQASGTQNVPAGTIVDTKIVHPRNYDFYMCAHAGIIGTSRPVHYHVLLDEIGFKPDDLQNLIHSLSYVNQRSTTATSIVAPVRYAHLAATQFGQFTKFEELLDYENIPELPRLRQRVESNMFFC